MDINTLRALSTVFAFTAFIGVCLWAYNSKLKQRFDADAQLPFEDEEQHHLTQQLTSQHEERQ